MSRSNNRRHPHYGRSACGVCSGSHRGRPDNSMSVQEELAEFEPCDDRTPLDDRDECGDLECYVCYPFLQDDVELRVPLLEMSR